MPRPGCEWTTREHWLPHYQIVKSDGTVVTLGDDRSWSIDNPENEIHRRADALIARGIAATDRIVILGCGPGNFLTEAIKARGRANCWGVDNSPFANSRGQVQGSGVILINADLASGQSFNQALNQATGSSNFRWIITESLWESYDNNEITVGLNVCEGLRQSQTPMTNIIHLVFTPPFNQPGLFNEKTMAQWKAMRSTHTWMNAEGYGVA
jgi:hypothetical protein